MTNKDTAPIPKYEAEKLISSAIREHELRKESSFVLRYQQEAEVTRLENRIVILEKDNETIKDRNKWLFRLVVGAVITSLIPIAIALISNNQPSKILGVIL